MAAGCLRCVPWAVLLWLLSALGGGPGSVCAQIGRPATPATPGEPAADADVVPAAGAGPDGAGPDGAGPTAPAGQALAEGVAAVPGLTLRWQAQKPCPSTSEVRAELLRVLGDAPAAGQPLSALARVVGGREGFSLDLQTEYRGEQGRRTLAATDCHDLLRTVSLVLALMLGRTPRVVGAPPASLAVASSSEVGASAPEPAAQALPAPERTPSASEAEVPTEVAADVAADVPVVAAAPAPSLAEGEAGAQIGVTLGVFATPGFLPVQDFSGLVGAEVRALGWLLALQASYWPGGRDSGSAVIDTRYQAAAVQLSLCRGGPLGALLVGLCAAGRVGAVRARGSAPAENVSLAGPVYGPAHALGLGAFAEWPRRGEVRLGLHLRGVAMLGRPRFAVDGLGEVYRMAPWLPEILLVASFIP